MYCNSPLPNFRPPTFPLIQWHDQCIVFKNNIFTTGWLLLWPKLFKAANQRSSLHHERKCNVLQHFEPLAIKMRDMYHDSFLTCYFQRNVRFILLYFPEKVITFNIFMRTSQLLKMYLNLKFAHRNCTRWGGGHK